MMFLDDNKVKSSYFLEISISTLENYELLISLYPLKT